MKWKKLVNESIEIEQLMEELRDWLIEETESGNNINDYVKNYVKDYDNDPECGSIYINLRKEKIWNEIKDADSPRRWRRYYKEHIKEALDESIKKFCKKNNYKRYAFSIIGDTADLDDWDFMVIRVNMSWLRHEID